jgi:hypothetical protein
MRRRDFIAGRKIFGLVLAAVFASVASISARSDAVAVIDPKAAAEFVLKTCLPAMEDLVNVEAIAQENKWFRLPDIPSNSKLVTSRSRWRVNGFSVATWSWIDGNLPSCFVGLLPDIKVDRDGFLDAISASVELKVISEWVGPDRITDASGHVYNDVELQSSPLRFRQETYEIIGGWPAKRVGLVLSSRGSDGTVSNASIYMEAPTAGEAPQDR